MIPKAPKHEIITAKTVAGTIEASMNVSGDAYELGTITTAGGIVYVYQYDKTDI